MKKLFVALLIVAAIVIVLHFLPVATWLRDFQTYVRGLGALGYVVYIVVYAICVVAFIPASILTLGAGAIFGFVGGTIVVVIGATLGATLAFLLARTVMRKRDREDDGEATRSSARSTGPSPTRGRRSFFWSAWRSSSRSPGSTTPSA